MRTSCYQPVPPRRRRLRVLSLPLRPAPLHASHRGELRRSLANWPDRVASPPQGRGMLHRFSPSWLRDFRFLRFNGHFPAPGSWSTTMASADSCPALTGQVSPGKDAVLPRTTAAFTSETQPNGFAVLCQLAWSRRPSMRFLFIGSRFLPSLLSAERSPGPP